MVGKVIALELRKHKRFFLSIVLVILLSLASTVVARTALGTLDFSEAVTGAGVFLIMGLPIIAVLFGATAATGLRKDPEKITEEMLPVHPFKKVLGAYLASFFYFLLIALCALGTLGSADIYELVWIWIGPSLQHFDWIIASLIYLHFLAFALSYWLKLPLLAAGVALIVACTQTLIMSYMYFFNGWWQIITMDSVKNFCLVTAFFPFVTGLVSLYILARKLEQSASIGYFKGSLIAFSLFSGIILSLIMVWWLGNSVEKDYRDLDFFYSFFRYW